MKNKFLIRIFQLFLLVNNSKIKKEKGYSLVLVNRDFSPFSFFNMIFINEKSVVRGNLETILAHEQIHIKQAHTLDIILAELLIMVQWFNPFAWLISRELKNLHEYLADEGVIREGIRVPDYQQLILNETIGIQVTNLANNFNISQLKRRIIMMSKKRSGNWAMSKALLALPVIIATGLFFSANSYSLNNMQEKSKGKPKSSTEVVTRPDEQPTYPNGDEARLKFMLENLKYPKTAKRDNVQGKVFITFIVDTDGSLTDIKILKGVRKDLDKEALRVIKLMPKWNPGKDKGQKVKTSFVLPIQFKLDKDKPGEKKK